MKCKRRIYNCIIILLLVIGIGIISYPVISNFWNQYQQREIIDGYQQAISGYTQEELDEMWKQAELYNEDLLKDEVIIDPFDQVKDQKANVAYYETLNPQNNGVMGKISIPKIGVDLPFYHGTSEDVLQKAIGHLEQTSLPIGGEGTHAVLSGHRGLPSAELFTDLNLLEVGDQFYIEVLGKTLAYEVDKISVVEPNQLEELAIVSGEDYVTLVTCTPYAVNSHRLLVRGTRVPYNEVVAEENNARKMSMNTMLPYMILAVIFVILLIIGLLMLKRKKQKRSIGNETKL